MKLIRNSKKPILLGFFYLILSLVTVSIISIDGHNSNNEPSFGNSVLADSTIQNFSLSPYATVTPSPVPSLTTQASWATGLATNPSAIVNTSGDGTTLTSIPMEPFANGPGGSTVMAKFKFHPWLQAAAAYSKDSVLKITFESRSDFRPLAVYDANVGLTDGWAMGTMQDQIGVENSGAYGDYSDMQLHQGQFEGYNMINLGKSTVGWTSYTVPINGVVDFSKDLQVFFLAEQSSEPQPQAWKLFLRSLRLNIELQK